MESQPALAEHNEAIVFLYLFHFGKGLLGQVKAVYVKISHNFYCKAANKEMLVFLLNFDEM